MNSSLFSNRNEELTSFSNRIFGNSSLRVGIVIDIIERDSKDNVSKLSTEYTVMAIEQNGNGPINSAIYNNCLALESFGGIADYFTFKYRKPKNSKKVSSSANPNNQEGSIVLLLCLDGNSEKAIIIGSLSNPANKRKLNKAKGQHLEGEYNGLRWEVDKDGAFKVTFKGATDLDGKPKTQVGGSEIKIEKDGSVEINDAKLSDDLAKGNRKQDSRLGKDNQQTTTTTNQQQQQSEGLQNEKFRIDRTAQTITLESRKDISLKTDANYNLTAKQNINVKAMDLLAQLEGKANVTVKGAIEIKSDAALKAEAMSMKFIAQESAELQAVRASVKAQQIFLGEGGSPALVINTNFLGIGNLGAPVISQAIGPFSAVVFIAS